MRDMDSKANITNPVQKQQVEKVVQALQQYVEKKNKQQVGALLDDSETVHMQFTFQKVPFTRKTIKLRLPWTLATEKTDVCLLVRDVTKNRDYSPTVRHFQQRLRRKGVTSISEILPLKALRLEYIQYEAKRNLASMHDVFLADAKIMHNLPNLLGKNFYGRKKFPIQINLGAKDLKKEVMQALSTSLCILSGRGSTVQVTVGHVGMKEHQLVENTMAAISKITSSIPGGPSNIKCAHLKTTHSPALLFYISEALPEDITLPRVKKVKRKAAVEEDLLDNAKICVTNDGRVMVVKPSEKTGQVGKTPASVRKQLKGKRKANQRALKKRKTQKSSK